MGTFVVPAGVGVVDETGIKIRIEDAVDGVVNEAVSHTSFVDVSTFWVGDDEVFVATVGVGVI
jgi:hypothetical protein